MPTFNLQPGVDPRMNRADASGQSSISASGDLSPYDDIEQTQRLVDIADSLLKKWPGDKRGRMVEITLAGAAAIIHTPVAESEVGTGESYDIALATAHIAGLAEIPHERPDSEVNPELFAMYIASIEDATTHTAMNAMKRRFRRVLETKTRGNNNNKPVDSIGMKSACKKVPPIFPASVHRQGTRTPQKVPAK